MCGGLGGTEIMTTPNHQPTPPPGMEILTDYTKPLPHPCFVWCGDIDGPVEWMPLAEPDMRFDSIPDLDEIYAIPITPTVPATGDATNEKGGDSPCSTTALNTDGQQKDSLVPNADPVSTVASNAPAPVQSHSQGQELLPCPFCGNAEISMIWIDESPSRHCNTCKASGPPALDILKCTELWNTRK